MDGKDHASRIFRGHTSKDILFFRCCWHDTFGGSAGASEETERREAVGASSSIHTRSWQSLNLAAEYAGSGAGKAIWLIKELPMTEAAWWGKRGQS
jgi:hypothetical protein